MRVWKHTHTKHGHLFLDTEAKLPFSASTVFTLLPNHHHHSSITVKLLFPYLHIDFLFCKKLKLNSQDNLILFDAYNAKKFNKSIIFWEVAQVEWHFFGRHTIRIVSPQSTILRCSTRLKSEITEKHDASQLTPLTHFWGCWMHHITNSLIYPCTYTEIASASYLRLKKKATMTDS